MEYGNIVHGKFVSRPNRFIAMVDVDGELVKCHVKNTGRCKELLVPGAEVLLYEPKTENRKTKYDLVSVYKGERLINMDSQAPNKIAGEYLENVLPGLISLKSEVTHGDSRFDFYAETEAGGMFIEVKGVTLEKENVAMFPDAPTERGVKHINGLIRLLDEGYRAMILFVVQMSDIKYMTPNMETHPKFGETLKKAYNAGVDVRAIDCYVYEGKVFPKDEIPVILE
ncbi:MAG: DNA/RNA nuclease SfsA [Oscillospiraceae bacterium]|nr:DNA/RNA nuclease SfsA [Oscillospiraceae bacterium]